MPHRRPCLGALVLTIALIVVGCSQPESPSYVANFPILKGPYLGQTLPGSEPQVFAPGLISTGLRTRDVTLTPDGQELYFCVTVGGKSAILVMRERDDRWSPPEVMEFARDPRWNDLEPHVAPDGRHLYFVSTRPFAAASGEDGEPGDENVWVCERQGDGWTAPTPLGSPVNTEAAEYFPSTTRDGTLYFTRRDEETRTEAIWRAPALPGGGHGEPERLPPEVNAAPTQFNAFVAPDESYLIVCAAGRDDNLGQVDYWVSFRDAEGAWRPAVNLGERFNGPGKEGWSPSVSPDGAVFFFMSRREISVENTVLRTWAGLQEIHAGPGNGLGQIWWTDTSFLAELRRDVLSK